MPETDFPKPPRAEPRPLDEWLAQSDRAEHGREAFFGGRTAAFKVFRDGAIGLARGTLGGETIVVQGAPGAGKTALMLECAAAVRAHSTVEQPWVAAHPYSSDLTSAEDLIAVVAEAVIAEKRRLGRHDDVSALANLGETLRAMGGTALRELSERGGGVLGVQVGGKQRDEPRVGASRLFREAAGLLDGVRVVLFVDEAQNLPVTGETKDIVDRLHRGGTGIALLPVFFGLSDTEDVLARCGLSRLGRGRVRELGPMSPEESRASLTGVFNAYGFGEPGPERDRWIDTLVEESQGWPQHINNVAVAAGGIIRDNSLRLEAAALEKAIAAGKQLKNDYYQRRLGRARKYHGLYKSLALTSAESDGGVLSRSLIESVAEPALTKRDLTIDDFLSESLHAGLLSPEWDAGYDAYRFPIPSLAQYLRNLPDAPEVDPRTD